MSAFAEMFRPLIGETVDFGGLPFVVSHVNEGKKRISLELNVARARELAREAKEKRGEKWHDCERVKEGEE